MTLNIIFSVVPIRAYHIKCQSSSSLHPYVDTYDHAMANATIRDKEVPHIQSHIDTCRARSLGLATRVNMLPKRRRAANIVREVGGSPELTQEPDKLEFVLSLSPLKC